MIKINSLQAENMKRIKAVQISPSEKGLTIVGGNNNQLEQMDLDTLHQFGNWLEKVGKEGRIQT